MGDMLVGALVMWAACTLTYVPAALMMCERERRRGFGEGVRARVEALLIAHERFRDMGWELRRS